MQLSTVSIVIEGGDRVLAGYTPPRVTRYSWGEEFQHPEMVHVQIGDVLMYGPPALVVELLGQALRKTYAAWGDGNPDGPGHNPSGAAAVVAPPAPPIDMNKEGGR